MQRVENRSAKAAPRFARERRGVRQQMLIEAAIRCLARGGIAAFTIDQISKEARVSRGLINHHFDGIEDLLRAVYESMTEAMGTAARATLFVDGGPRERLDTVLEAMWTPPMFSKTSLRAWLALWGEVATNGRLRAAHRRSYDAYRQAMADAIAGIARERSKSVDASALAMSCIALIDGLWIEWCLDSTVVTRDKAKAAVYDFLEARLGRLKR
jgi:TetR/AcrR family transcriptional regulator, transcriptional repressor of bet genes